MSDKYILTWDMLQVHARILAKRLLPAKQWRGIIAISRGGLVPSAILARELGLRYIDTICVASYDHNSQRALKIIKQIEGNGDGYIIVDDLVDTGRTAKTILDMYPKGYFIAIFAKPAGRPLVHNYVIDIPQHTWLEQPWDMEKEIFIKPLCEE